MTIARLKAEPTSPDLKCLGQLVEAVERRLFRARHTTGWRNEHRDWAEAQALCRSIAEDPGWLLFVADRGRVHESLKMYLFAPDIALSAIKDSVEVRPFRGAFWSYTLGHAVQDAMKARFKRLRDEVPASTSDTHELARLAWHARPLRSNPIRTPQC